MSRKAMWSLVSIILLVLFLGAGCAPAASEKDLKELQSQVESLQESLNWTQQQLFAAENTINQVQQQNTQLQSQMDQTLTECSSCIEIAEEQVCCDEYCAGSSYCDAYLSSCSSIYTYPFNPACGYPCYKYPVYFDTCKYPYSYYQDSCYYPHTYYQCHRPEPRCHDDCPPPSGHHAEHEHPSPPPKHPFPPPEHHFPHSDHSLPPLEHEPLHITGNVTQQEAILQVTDPDPLPAPLQLNMAIMEAPLSEPLDAVTEPLIAPPVLPLQSTVALTDLNTTVLETPAAKQLTAPDLLPPPSAPEPPQSPLNNNTENTRTPTDNLTLPPETTPVLGTIAGTVGASFEGTQIAEVTPPPQMPASNVNANRLTSNENSQSNRSNNSPSAKKPEIVPPTQIAMAQMAAPQPGNPLISNNLQPPDASDQTELKKPKKKNLENPQIIEPEEDEEDEEDEDEEEDEDA